MAKLTEDGVIDTDGVELIIIIIGTFGQALAGEAHAVNIFAVIILWRFVVSTRSFKQHKLDLNMPPGLRRWE